MRKLVVRLRPHAEFIRPFEGMLSHFESFELIELVKVDFEKGMKIGVVEIVLKKGVRLEDVDLPKGYEILGILNESGSRYVLVAKITAPKEMIPLFKMFDIDVVWNTPMRKTRDEVVIGVLGSDENLRRLIDALRHVSDIIDLRFQRPTFSSDDLLSCLTAKQKNVMAAAREAGYYEYPRRTNAVELAERLGISKATALEHLRKAEVRLMGAILNG